MVDKTHEKIVSKGKGCQEYLDFHEYLSKIDGITNRRKRMIKNLKEWWENQESMQPPINPDKLIKILLSKAWMNGAGEVVKFIKSSENIGKKHKDNCSCFNCSEDINAVKVREELDSEIIGNRNLDKETLKNISKELDLEHSSKIIGSTQQEKKDE